MSELQAPTSVTTERLLLRRPLPSDAAAIFTRYAADPEVTRYMAWPTHQTLADTQAFLAFSDEHWRQWPAGPYLVFAKDDGRLLGGAGFLFETSSRAMTGYVLARDSWGRGYATEALAAVVGVARSAGIRRLYALCHVAHDASTRVLEKCGFEREGTLRCYEEFPNLSPGEPSDVICHALIL